MSSIRGTSSRLSPVVRVQPVVAADFPRDTRRQREEQPRGEEEPVEVDETPTSDVLTFRESDGLACLRRLQRTIVVAAYERAMGANQ